MVLPLLVGMSLLAAGAKDVKKERDAKMADIERTRQAGIEDRAHELEQRARTKRMQSEQDAEDAAMKAAGATVNVDPNMTPDPTSDNRDAGLPGTAPPIQDGYRVAGKTVADKSAADGIAASMNTSGARLRRQAGVKAAAGKTLDAAKLTEIATSLEKEGTLKFIDANKAMVPSVEDIKAGKDTFPLVGVDEFNLNGTTKLPPGVTGRAKVVKLKSGQEVVDFEAVDAAGKPIAPSARTLESIYAYSRAELAKQERDDFAAGQRREHEVTMEGIAKQNADSSASLRAAQADAALARSEAAAARAGAGGKATPEPAAETPESTFDAKTAADIAKDMVKKEAEEAALAQKPMTGAQVAKRVDEIVGAMRQTHTNRFVQGQVQRVLGAAQNDPAAYAQEYAKALKLMPQATLAQMGFNPPPAPAGAARPAAAPAAAAPAAAAPAAAAAPPAAAATPVATMASTAGQDKVLQSLESANKAALDQLAAQLATAKQQLAATAKSGDPQALARYAALVQQATEALKTEAAKRLGNRAPAYLQTVL